MAIRLPCYCATLRRLARIVSARYDTALRGTGLTITQFTLLTVLGEASGARIKDLGDVLAMDQTTLSRTLRLMQRDGLISPIKTRDRRESRWTATSRGRQRMRGALPHWLAAQKDLEERVGTAAARQLASTSLAVGERLSE